MIPKHYKPKPLKSIHKENNCAKVLCDLKAPLVLFILRPYMRKTHLENKL